MVKKPSSKTPSLTDLLRKGLSEADSIRAVARATELHHATLLRFLRGDRTLKLDSVEKLMAYFGIEVQQKGGE